MTVRLIDGSIVLLGKNLDPTILTPQWVKKECGFEEEPINYISSNKVSFFESSNLLVIVDDERLQAISKGDKVLQAITSLVKKYVEDQDRSQYVALGLNFAWEINKALPVNLTIDNKVDFNEVIPGHKLRYGGIILAEGPGYTLRLYIEPQQKEKFVARFNYHHELKEITKRDVIMRISNYTELFEHSGRIVKRITEV